MTFPIPRLRALRNRTSFGSQYLGACPEPAMKTFGCFQAIAISSSVHGQPVWPPTSRSSGNQIAMSSSRIGFPHALGMNSAEWPTWNTTGTSSSAHFA